MNPDECRKAFKAWCKEHAPGPQPTLLWNIWQAAWNSRTESKPVTREDDGSVTVVGRRYAQWPNNSWRGTPAQAVEAYEADAEMVPACAYDAALADRNALIRLLAQLSAPQSPVVPGVDLSELQRWDEYDFGLAKNHWGPWVKFEDVRHFLATGGRQSWEDRYREALERIARPVRNDYEELADIAREALATTNAKEPDHGTRKDL